MKNLRTFLVAIASLAVAVAPLGAQDLPGLRLRTEASATCVGAEIGCRQIDFFITFWNPVWGVAGIDSIQIEIESDGPWPRFSRPNMIEFEDHRGLQFGGTNLSPDRKTFGAGYPLYLIGRDVRVRLQLGLDFPPPRRIRWTYVLFNTDTFEFGRGTVVSVLK